MHRPVIFYAFVNYLNAYFLNDKVKNNNQSVKDKEQPEIQINGVNYPTYAVAELQKKNKQKVRHPGFISKIAYPYRKIVNKTEQPRADGIYKHHNGRDKQKCYSRHCKLTATRTLTKIESFVQDTKQYEGKDFYNYFGYKQ